MKLLLFAFSALLIFGSCDAQKDIPVNVKAAFTTKYPTAENAEWEIDDEEYEVEFEINGKEMSSTFLKKGIWLETEFETPKEDIPANIQEAIKLQYAGYEIDEAEVIETPDMKGYEIALEKGKIEIEVIFSMDGRFVKEKEAEKKEVKVKK